MNTSATVSPTSDDPLARQVARTPIRDRSLVPLVLALLPGGRWVLRASSSVWLMGALFLGLGLLVGLGFTAAFAARAFKTATGGMDWGALPVVIAPFVFVLVGVLILLAARQRHLFDPAQGWYWQASRDDAPLPTAEGPSALRLGSIQALQLLSWQALHGGHRHLRCELNLVLPDGQRRRLGGQEELPRLRSDARALGEALGWPVWEHSASDAGSGTTAPPLPARPPPVAATPVPYRAATGLSLPSGGEGFPIGLGGAIALVGAALAQGPLRGLLRAGGSWAEIGAGHLALVLVALAAAAGGALLAQDAWRRARRFAALAAGATVVPATLVGTERCAAAKYRDPNYQLVAQWFDPARRQVRMFLSLPLRGEDVPAEGSVLPVLVNPADLHWYWLPTSAPARAEPWAWLYRLGMSGQAPALASAAPLSVPLRGALIPFGLALAALPWLIVGGDTARLWEQRAELGGFVLAGVLTALGGIGWIAFGRWRRRRQQALQTGGQRIEARVVGVRRADWSVSGGLRPWWIDAEWTAPDGQRHALCSAPLGYHPGAFLGATVPARIDPANPRRHWIDTSGLPPVAGGPAASQIDPQASAAFLVRTDNAVGSCGPNVRAAQRSRE